MQDSNFSKLLAKNGSNVKQGVLHFGYFLLSCIVLKSAFYINNFQSKARNIFSTKADKTPNKKGVKNDI